MLDTTTNLYVQQLADFIISKHFDPVTQKTPYYHMGATITDAVLQAGLNYNHIVYPRVLKLLKEYPNFTSTCDFIILMQTIPLSEIINWRNKKKLELIEQLSYFLYKNGIENENQLAQWLNNECNVKALINISGVGPKTIDYLKMLSGLQSIAIDRHLFEFLRLAGIFVNTYEEASEIYQKTAKYLSISNYELDQKIWLYMSKQ